jgi:DNA polymerase-4
LKRLFSSKITFRFQRDIRHDSRGLGDLRALALPTLEAHFGRYGLRLCELARGIDSNPVTPDRPTKSISAEDTFERDIPLSQTEDLIKRLEEKVWSASRREARVARTVVLKLKTKEFDILGNAVCDCDHVNGIRRE